MKVQSPTAHTWNGGHDRLAEDFGAGLEYRLLRRRRHQPVAEAQLDPPPRQDLLREQSQPLIHFLQDALARMNQHAADFLVRNARVVPRHGPHKIVHLRDHFHS
jgi:hypothetical protein